MLPPAQLFILVNVIISFHFKSQAYGVDPI